MADPVDAAQFKDALIVLGAAAVVVPVFHSLKVSPVLGYVLIGMVVGPFGLGAFAAEIPWLGYVTIGDKSDISSVAEFGVVLLLFMIGLELSLERLQLMRRLVFGLGTVQMVASALAIGVVAYAATGSVAVSAVIGLALAMSSTAIVTQILAERKQLTAPWGRASFAVLLFQDIAVVPVLFAVGVMGGDTQGSLIAALGLALVTAVVTVVAVFAGGRIVLRPLFRRVAQTDSPELFMAACLLVIIVTGLATAAAGLSMALGALIAGLLLAETEYRRQIEVMIEPFKGLLVGVFLISVGMSVDLGRIAAEPFAVAAASAGLIAAKALIVALAAPLFGLTIAQGVRSGMVLGPGSEFSFIILGVAGAAGIVNEDTVSFLLIVAALTMAAIPFLQTIGKTLEKQLSPVVAPHPATLIPLPEDAGPRVIIAGFGRVGRVTAALLTEHKIPFLAVDANADTVARARDEGHDVFFGNVKQIEFLRRCGIATARALVLTMDAPKAASEVVGVARAERTDLQIIVRARDADHAAELYRLGATDAVPETVESSLQLGEAVLVDVGVPMGLAIASIHEKRAEIRASIQAAAPQTEIRLQARRRLRDAKPKV
ncbi:MAG: cation:proton antiporter [Micropepsaceae bacterium]